MRLKLASNQEQIEKALAEIGWRLDDYIHAVTAGKSYKEMPNDQEIEDNLRLLDPHERSVVKQIEDSQKNTISNLYAEVAEKFGIAKQFRQEEGMYRDFEPYTTVARSIELRERPLDINTVLLEFVEERGRILRRNGRRIDVDVIRWLTEFHPEMLRNDVIVADNNASDSTSVIEQDSLPP